MYAFGIDLGGTKTQILKIDSHGKVLERLKIPTDVEEGADSIIASITKALEPLMEKKPPFGIGVGVAGQIEEKSGKVLFAPNLKWKDVPLGEILGNKLKTKVRVINDVRAATLGEHTYGSAKGAKNLLCIFVGTGIGGGALIDGKLLKGPNNCACEIGHMIIDVRGRPCTCGSRGCLETIAAGWGMEARVRDAINDDPTRAKVLLALASGDPNGVKGPMIHEAAKDKDPLALGIVKDAEEALIAATASLANILNPSLIVFGGGIIDVNPEIVGRIEKGVQKKALKAALKDIEFRASALKGEAGAFGAASMVFHED